MFGLEAHDPKVTSKAAGQKLVFSKMVDDDIICEVCIFKKTKIPKTNSDLSDLFVKITSSHNSVLF